MKKCLKCECIYPDYYEKCPACGSKNKKEWKHIGGNKEDESEKKKSIEKEEDIYKDIIDISDFNN